VEVVAIYWGAAWVAGTDPQLASQLDRFFDFIVTSSYMDFLHEYSTASTSIDQGRRLTSVIGSSGKPGIVTPNGRRVTDAQIQTALQGWISDCTVPATTANTVYFIFFPPNVACVGPSGGGSSCSGFCGYHFHIDKVYYARGLFGCTSSGPF
jgi:hypothetical protein